MRLDMLTILTVVLGCALAVSLAASPTLRLVNLVYRHGDRSPYRTYPNNLNSIDKNWPQGLGWLTTEGMKQHYSLGRFIRRRYTGFLSDKYLHTEIRVESSDVDRCLMSAYSNLAGLYPPSGDQVWNSNIPWQPIPVHTRPEVEDNMLAMQEPCKKYDQIEAANFASNRIKQLMAGNQEFLQLLSRETGFKPFNVRDILPVADTLYCEKVHNITWPAWVNDTIYAKARDLEQIGFDLLFHDNVGRLKGGPLVKKWIDLAQQKVATKTISTKMNVFSAHDSTVVSVLSALKLYNNLIPPYTSTLFMELHEATSGVFHVELYYRNVSSTDPNDDTQPHQLTIPGCSSQCPLTNFVSLTKDMVPTDWDAECAASNTGTIVGKRGQRASPVLKVLYPSFK
ncbi:lysosomal acid phosphatase-like isoform X1 [Haliotis rubra]|uniref:lysosomal acid phosphatase-like isoform X1 n=1 Tax=Haliotis rubra TaxID=36100 RepID=UPI001EE60BF8|nr:lysosomal acid phosphatase-like isoform X1 [Haliotis rubra]